MIRTLSAAIAIVFAGTVASVAQAPAQRPAEPAKTYAEAVEQFVIGNRILGNEGVIADGFGHLSFRSPTDPTHFYMARARGALVMTAADILEFDQDGNALDAQGKRLFGERYIHAEIYRARPDVNAVVHSHVSSVLPFGITKTPLRPVSHMGGFLLREVPLFEIRDYGGDATNMLVNSRVLGAGMAKVLGNAPVVLMRGHGFTAVGSSIKQAVFRSVYTDVTARVQTEAMKMGALNALNDVEAAKVADTNDASIDRSWEVWQYKALANTPKM